MHTIYTFVHGMFFHTKKVKEQTPRFESGVHFKRFRRGLWHLYKEESVVPRVLGKEQLEDEPVHPYLGFYISDLIRGRMDTGEMEYPELVKYFNSAGQMILIQASDIKGHLQGGSQIEKLRPGDGSGRFKMYTHLRPFGIGRGFVDPGTMGELKANSPLTTLSLFKIKPNEDLQIDERFFYISPEEKLGLKESLYINKYIELLEELDKELFICDMLDNKLNDLLQLLFDYDLASALVRGTEYALDSKIVMFLFMLVGVAYIIYLVSYIVLMIYKLMIKLIGLFLKIIMKISLFLFNILNIMLLRLISYSKSFFRIGYYTYYEYLRNILFVTKKKEIRQKEKKFVKENETQVRKRGKAFEEGGNETMEKQEITEDEEGVEGFKNPFKLYLTIKDKEETIETNDDINREKFTGNYFFTTFKSDNLASEFTVHGEDLLLASYIQEKKRNQSKLNLNWFYYDYNAYKNRNNYKGVFRYDFSTNIISNISEIEARRLIPIKKNGNKDGERSRLNFFELPSGVLKENRDKTSIYGMFILSKPKIRRIGEEINMPRERAIDVLLLCGFLYISGFAGRGGVEALINGMFGSLIITSKFYEYKEENIQKEMKEVKSLGKGDDEIEKDDNKEKTEEEKETEYTLKKKEMLAEAKKGQKMKLGQMNWRLANIKLYRIAKMREEFNPFFKELPTVLGMLKGAEFTLISRRPLKGFIRVVSEKKKLLLIKIMNYYKEKGQLLKRGRKVINLKNIDEDLLNGELLRQEEEQMEELTKENLEVISYMRQEYTDKKKEEYNEYGDKIYNSIAERLGDIAMKIYTGFILKKSFITFIEIIVTCLGIYYIHKYIILPIVIHSKTSGYRQGFDSREEYITYYDNMTFNIGVAIYTKIKRIGEKIGIGVESENNIGYKLNKDGNDFILYEKQFLKKEIFEGGHSTDTLAHIYERIRVLHYEYLVEIYKICICKGDEVFRRYELEVNVYNGLQITIMDIKEQLGEDGDKFKGGVINLYYEIEYYPGRGVIIFIVIIAIIVYVMIAIIASFHFKVLSKDKYLNKYSYFYKYLIFKYRTFSNRTLLTGLYTSKKKEEIEEFNKDGERIKLMYKTYKKRR